MRTPSILRGYFKSRILLVILGTSAMITAAMAMSCAGSLSVTCTSGVHNCKATGKVTGTWGGGMAPIGGGGGIGGSGAELSNMYADFTTQNISIPNGTYSGKVNIYSGTTLVASTTFDYYVSSGRAFPSDPSTLQSWINSHLGSNDTIKVVAPGLPYTVTNSSATSGQLSTTVYDGTTVLSSTSTSIDWSGSSVSCQSTLKNGQKHSGSSNPNGVHGMIKSCT